MSEFNPYQGPQSDIVPPVPQGELQVHVPVRRPAGHGMQWVGDAWTIFTRSWGLWIGGALVLWLIGAVAGMIPLLGAVAPVVLGPVLYAGVYVVARHGDQGTAPGFGDFFAGFQQRTGPLLMLGLLALVWLAVVVAVAALVAWLVMGEGFGAMAGTWAQLAAGQPPAQTAPDTLYLNLALVGLVFLGVLLPYMAALWFATPLVFFQEDMKPGRAMKMSLVACIRNFFPLLVYGLLGLVLVVAGSIPFGLGLLVVWPLLLVTAWTSFRDIFIAPASGRGEDPGYNSAA